MNRVASIALANEMTSVASCNLSFSPGLGVICENTARLVYAMRALANDRLSLF